ncbi:Na+ driven multidrug/antimicrobial extrusion protein MatE [Gluconacetobacter johannae DSM 13595]|nr:Na+ driven multidrug/antimicrobial extrusion protein MatE [Gluconacetobacter johannae DSM 13595]
MTGRPARFCSGAIMRHVVVMAGTGAIGLMAVFAVDLLNLFYISRLNDPALTAAIGFTGAVGYVQIAVSIGMSIGLGAVTARQIGCGHHERARRIASSFLLVMVATTALLGLGMLLFSDPILHLFGATGRAAEQAGRYIRIVSPGLWLIAVGMGCSSLLRAVGDARRSMNVTLIGALASAALDPLLIFWLHLGLDGAAISTILSRGFVAALGFHAVRRHDMLEWPAARYILPDARLVGGVATPAILTNLATPIGGLFVTHAMATFGLAAVAGQATIDRIVPVAFAFVFALTGSVGPIMSQNLGAGQLDRVHQTLVASLKLVALCVAITWLILLPAQNLVVAGFSAQGTTAALIRLFCTWTIGGYVFIGMLFVANTAFNNLGFPLYSTLFNWGRATLGTIPFVWVGMRFGPCGVQVGQVLGSVVVGSWAVLSAFSVVRRLKPGPVMPGLATELPARTAKGAMVELDELDEEQQIADNLADCPGGRTTTPA